MGSSSDNTLSDAGQSSIGTGSSRAWMRMTNKETFKWPKIHTSYSVNVLSDVFSNTKGEKADLLRSTGFGFLLSLPRPGAGSSSMVNRQFSLWLMKIMDPLNCAIHVKGRGRIPITPEDVNRVLGIPYKGEDIEDESYELRDVVYTRIKGLLMLDDDTPLDLKTIGDILRKDLEEPMETRQKVAFMVASVIYATSYFLAPRGRPASISKDILIPLMDPSNIPRMDWARYVLRILCGSSSKVKRDLFMMRKSVTLDGCLLLLQIMYLDNVDFGTDEASQLGSPRMVDYNYMTLDKLITLEKYNAATSIDEVYGNRQLKEPWKVIYSRGDKYKMSDSDHSEPSSDSEDQTQLEEVINAIVQQHKDHINQTMESVATYLIASTENLYDKVTSVSKNLRDRQKRKREISRSSKKHETQGSSSKHAVNRYVEPKKKNKISGEKNNKGFKVTITSGMLQQGLQFRSIYTDRAAAGSGGHDIMTSKIPTPTAPAAAGKSTRIRFSTKSVAKELFPDEVLNDKEQDGHTKVGLHGDLDNPDASPNNKAKGVNQDTNMGSTMVAAGCVNTTKSTGEASASKIKDRTTVSTECTRTGAGRSVKIRNIQVFKHKSSSTTDTPSKDDASGKLVTKSP
ncbi:hypothetical protein ACP70R_027417 [Stipagrostis hirtigluma subsp. patula]